MAVPRAFWSNTMDDDTSEPPKADPFAAARAAKARKAAEKAEAELADAEKLAARAGALVDHVRGGKDDIRVHWPNVSTWKGQLKLQYPNPNDYQTFMG